MPGTYDPAVVDRWVRGRDRDAFAMARRITREEGILAGESCGTALVAALDGRPRADGRDRAATADAVIVVLLPDGGRNYLSKLYNDEWMRVNGLLATTGSDGPRRRAAPRRHHGEPIPAVVLARTTDRVGDGDRPAPAVRHQPAAGVGGGRRRRDREAIVGSVSEKGLLDRAYRDPAVVERTVGEVMDRPLPTIDVGGVRSTRPSRSLSDGASALSRSSRPGGRPAS